MKLLRYLSLILLLYSFDSHAKNSIKEFVVFIDKEKIEYTVDVNGTMDPENIEITIENLGVSPVVNPRITVNGLYDWYDAKSMAAEITRGCHTDEEKAFAIWWWVRYRTYQRDPLDGSVHHPVRALNGYGYGVCSHVASWMKCLWTAVGLKARVQELWGHTVSEVYYNGAWHLMDGNAKVFYLGRDNRTIASLAELEQDKWLIERTIHPREMEPWFLGTDPPGRNEDFVRYIVSRKDNYEDFSYDSEISKDYSMAMTLKPGEKLVRWWQPKLGKYEGRDMSAEIPQIYANGQLIWEPELRTVNIRPYLSIPEHGNITTRIQNVRGPAIGIADLQDELHTRPSVFSIPIDNPYRIVGGRFSCTLVKEGSSKLDSASVSFGQQGWHSGNLYEYRWSQGAQAISLDLDSRILKSGATYKYTLGFAIRGNAESNPPTQTGVDAFRSETDLQVSSNSLPALSLGKNTVRFWHESPQPVRVRITHRWKEIHDRRYPGKVAKAVESGDGNEVPTLTPVLKWSPAREGDPAADHQVMVSLRSDCRWPLATTLHQNVGSAQTEWRVPASFLNPGTTYYWKVCARSVRGDVGEWGRVFSFKTSHDAK
jgi:hypothetical protein